MSRRSRRKKPKLEQPRLSRLSNAGQSQPSPALPLPPVPSLVVEDNRGQVITSSGSGPSHSPQNVSGDYVVGNVYNRPTGGEVSWPMRVGVVPQLADGFQSRSGPQNALAEGLATGSTTVLTQVLTGLGGNGKSQLAAAHARDLWDRDQLDLLVWITAASRGAIVTGYAQIARSVGLAVDPSDPEQAATAFLGWAESTDRHWLVVLDDLSNPVDLTGLWLEGRAGRVLITTRRHDSVLSGRGRKVLDVGLFTPDEACAYLNAKLGGAGSQPDVLEQAADLVNDLGLLPLALAQAAADMAEQGWTCAEYRVRFSDQRLRLADLLPPDALADDYASGPHAHHRATIATTWTLSVQAADRLPPVGLALPLLQLAAYLDPNGIPVGVFLSEPSLRFLNETMSEFASPDSQPGLNADHVRQALGNLTRLSLIELDAPAAHANTVRVHALVQRAVRDGIQDSLGRVAADALLAAWPANDYLPEHALLAASLRANTASLEQYAGDYVREPGAHAVLFVAGRSLTSSGLAAQAVNYWTTMASHLVAVLGPEHPDTLSSRNNLASAYQDAGRLAEAVLLFEATLADYERLLGREHPDTLTSRNNLALAYWDTGRLAEALSLLEVTLADCERLLGREHPDTLTGRNNLAWAYRAAGRLAEALSLLEATLADRERLLGPQHLKALSSRNNLALAYRDAGRLAEALPLMEATLADCERLLGQVHPDTLTSRNNLAMAYRDAGRLAEALPLFEATLADRERLLGREHPDTLASRNDLALAYRDAGRLAEALSLFEATLADRERLLGQEHPDALVSRNNLAYVQEEASRDVTDQ
ncbi:MAG: hypothetical protein QOE53_1978 [Pseudonocardiales bacterium]|nr:hypothetical protein [Pseudonocardiales bacterium]